MKLKGLLFSTVLLLSGCSMIENDSIESENNQIKDETEMEEKELAEEPKEKSEEEKMIEKLPKTASVEDWNLILVGPWNELPKDFNPELVEVNNEQRIDARIEQAWNDWYQAALEAGHRLFFASGYRPVELQEANFNNKVQQNL